MENKEFKNLIIFTVISVFLTIFIFSNSLKGSTATNSDSGFIMQIIKPFVDKICNIDEELLHIIIRKLAHFTEFCWLGIATSCFCVLYKKYKNKFLLGSNLFYCLFIGVTDEFIQSFTGRTSMVSDVLIDFSGALFGIVLVYLINLIYNKCKRIKGFN